jgi:hypothetical protein
MPYVTCMYAADTTEPSFGAREDLGTCAASATGLRSVWTQNISQCRMAMNSGSSMRSTTRANAPCTLGGLRLSRGTSVPLVPGKNVAKTSCYNATVIRFRVSVWSVRQTCSSRANRTAPNLACKFVTRHGLKMSNHLKSIWTLYDHDLTLPDDSAIEITKDSAEVRLLKLGARVISKDLCKTS